VFAIVDLSRRPSRGQILMIVDDQSTAADIAVELTHGATEVSVQYITTLQVEQLLADAHAGREAQRSRAIA
jgi:hypothetical protein